jgi:CHASE1-domain containing sensor protein
LLLLVGVIGTLFTLAVTSRLHDLERDAAIKEFKIHVNESMASLDREIALNFEVLHSMKILFDRSELPTDEEFARAATATLDRHPNIQALEWIPRVSHADRSSFETARRARFHSFEFTDRLLQGEMVRAADREEYYPVYFLEPFVGNELALGFDLASNPTRLAALEESRDSARLRASEPITLVQEGGNQKGFIAFLPVYEGEPSTLEERRSSLKGFVLGVYRIGDIFNSALAPLNI